MTHSSLEEGGGAPRAGEVPTQCFCVLPAWTRSSTQAETSATQEEVGACPPLPHHGAQPDMGNWSPQAAPGQVRVRVQAQWRPSWGRGPEEEATGSADSPGLARADHRSGGRAAPEDVARRASRPPAGSGEAVLAGGVPVSTLTLRPCLMAGACLCPAQLFSQSTPVPPVHELAMRSRHSQWAVDGPAPPRPPQGATQARLRSVV